MRARARGEKTKKTSQTLTDGQRLADKLLLDLHRLRDDLDQPRLGQLVLQQRVEQARKVTVQPLVAADELVGEGEAGHEAALLQPKDCAERTTEEDAFHGSEGNDALGEGCMVAVEPLQRPVRLLLDAGDGLNGIE